MQEPVPIKTVSHVVGFTLDISVPAGIGNIESKPLPTTNECIDLFFRLIDCEVGWIEADGRQRGIARVEVPDISGFLAKCASSHAFDPRDLTNVRWHDAFGAPEASELLTGRRHPISNSDKCWIVHGRIFELVVKI